MNFGCFFFTLFLCEIKVISIFHDVIDLKKKIYTIGKYSKISLNLIFVGKYMCKASSIFVDTHDRY